MANATVTGLAKAATTQTLHGEMNATDAKNRKRVEVEVVVVVNAMVDTASNAMIMVHHVVVAMVPIKDRSKDVIKAQCEAVVIAEMTVTDHTKNKNPFDLMITDFYI